MEKLLRQAGYQHFTSINDSREVVGQLRTFRPDLIVLFRIYLPTTDENAGEPLFTESAQTAVSAGETILLVEDDEHVRRLVREILAQEGYEIREAISSAAALESVRENPGTVSLLLTDLVMPSMNGFDLAAEAARLEPGIRVLFMSGYTDADLANVAALRPETALLEKPFTANNLLASVHRALTEPAPPCTTRG